MTPLMQEIMRDQCLPVAKRKFKDQSGLLPRLNDFHCFEVTDIFDAAGEIAKRELGKGRTLDVLCFLPAPRTWIEWRRDDGSREGVLLEEVDGLNFARAYWAYSSEGMFLSAKKGGALKLHGDGNAASDHVLVREFKNETMAEAGGWTVWIYAILAMINTPRVIGRRQHMPHRGLEKRLIANKALVGKFPLRAWTEIRLEVAPPKNESGEPSKGAHLTGERALHFCRAHLRVRLGKLEYVSAHWRGDASLGIKQSRYKLTKSRRAA